MYVKLRKKEASVSFTESLEFFEYVNPFVPKLIVWGTEKDQNLKGQCYHEMLLVTLVDSGSLNCTMHVDCAHCSVQKGQFAIAHTNAVRPQ